MARYFCKVNFGVTFDATENLNVSLDFWDITQENKIDDVPFGFLFNQSKQFDRLLTFFGAIPTARDVQPVRALRRALMELDRGEIVGVFPEARRVEYWGEEQPSRGAAWLALATGATLLPVAMQGTQHTLGLVEKRFRTPPIRIWIEKPIDPLDFTDHADPIKAVMAEWREAMDARLRPWWRDREGEVARPE